MEDQAKQMMASALMGAPQQQQPQGVGEVLGLNAMQAQKYYPIWQQQSIDAQSQGQPFPQFNEWLKMQQGGQVAGSGL